MGDGFSEEFRTAPTSIRHNLGDSQDRDFLERVYSTDPAWYQDRLKRIGFSGKNRILDLGCGFGQWSMALAQLNDEVIGLDLSKTRVSCASKIARQLNVTRKVNFLAGSLESLPLENNTFDAVFCYSTLYQTYYPDSLSQIFDCLKKNGDFYFSTNALGWYLYNLFEKPNPSKNFNPRVYSLKTIANTIVSRFLGRKVMETDLVTPKNKTIKQLKAHGFTITETGADGEINRNQQSKPRKSPYSKTYLGLNNVFEILAKK